MTELQKHVAFFDRDHDGIITFDETYQGARAFRSFVVCATPFVAIESLLISGNQSGRVWFGVC